MATLSVLGQLMGGLVPPAGPPQPYDVMEVNTQRAASQTALIQLEELKRAQASEAEVRAFLAQHPELALGGGLQSTLGGGGMPPGPPAGAGPLMQQQVVPGQAPGAPQVVPGGQNLSRFAGVSPPGGPPMQSTLGGPGPQQGQDPRQQALLELVRRDPAAGMAIQERMFKIQEGRLTRTINEAGYVARILQGVTNQETYEPAKQEIGREFPQLAAQLPSVFSKEALAPFLKRAVDVKTNAELQIESRKADIEEGKLNVQLANAGYQGLGTDVIGILRGLTPEQVTEFGGRTSAKAIAYAADQVKKLDVEKREKEGLAGAQATAQAGREARLEKTVSEVMGERTTKLFDTQTMDTVNSRMSMKEYEALPPGRVKELSSRETEQIENVKNSVPIVAQLQEHIDKIYGPGGVLARMTPDERADLAAVPGRWASQYAQKYPEVTQAQRFINSNAGALARALAGEKGAMAEGDVARAKEMLPNLETTLKVWPPANIGINSPDTRAVALGSMNSIVDMINARVRTILGNEQFTHPKLHRYETAAAAQQATGGPSAPPPVAPPALPIPPLVGPNPNLPPTQGPLGAPPQQRYVPPAPTAPAVTPSTPAPAPTAPAPTAPTPPTARSTPAQDEAYRLSLQPPGRQSQATPGRRGIELARASGAKVMDMVDVEQAMAETGRSRAEVLAAARQKGYTIYGGGSAMA